MTELLERKIRLHAQHLYDQRGQQEGQALQDWVEAESLVLENSILAPLYRKAKKAGTEEINSAPVPANPTASEVCQG
jgi:hypothetical protein